MKINDVEKVLGITKANIRFYEKEGLIAPRRGENGYREYDDTDLRRLKDIVILRKLGLPVQQIADILDGAISLQDALQVNIRTLQEELDKLSGSLAICRQLQQEDCRTLDTERYWDILHKQEKLGFQFQSLLNDYLKFSELNYEWLFWPMPVDFLRSPWKVGVFIAAVSCLSAMSQCILAGGNFFASFFLQVLSFLRTLAVWTAVFVPLYMLSKRKPKLANGIMTALLIALPIAAVILAIWIITAAYTL